MPDSSLLRSGTVFRPVRKSRRRSWPGVHGYTAGLVDKFAHAGNGNEHLGSADSSCQMTIRRVSYVSSDCNNPCPRAPGYHMQQCH